MSLFSRKTTSGIDWLLLGPALGIIFAGVITMTSFGEVNSFAVRQLVFTIVGIVAAYGISFLDVRSLASSRWVIPILYGVGILLLLGLFVFGATFNGATSWYSLGVISFQPVDIMNLFFIFILAKYLSRRHVEIARFKHLIVTGIYFFIPFVLVVLQPDFGSAMVLLAIWIGVLLMSGLTRRHIVIFAIVAAVVGGVLWGGVFQDYQKERITAFLSPQADVLGAGYNAYQSKIAIGSGQLLGKGVGYGTQSRLQFLPENETDFIFASFAEEWGFVGALAILIFFGIIFVRLMYVAQHASSNFLRYIIIGAAIYMASHMILNIGMNLGLLPVTGVTLPFMSYGGSHLVLEWILLGVVLAIQRYHMRVAHPDDMKYEFEGLSSE